MRRSVLPASPSQRPESSESRLQRIGSGRPGEEREDRAIAPPRDAAPGSRAWSWARDTDPLRRALRTVAHVIAGLWLVASSTLAIVMSAPWVLPFGGVAIAGTYAAFFALRRKQPDAAIHIGTAASLLALAGSAWMSGANHSPVIGVLAAAPLFPLGFGRYRWGAAYLGLVIAIHAAFAAHDVAMGAATGAALGLTFAHGWAAINVAVVSALVRRVHEGIRVAVERRVESAENLAEERNIARARAQADSDRRRAFVATISHELRTPLAAMIGMTNALEGTTLDPVQREIVSAMRTSGASLHALVDDVLDEERLERGRVELHAVPTDIEKVVAEVVELFAPSAQGKGVEIVAETAPLVPRLVLVDPLRLKQVITNLVSNATKFTTEGEIHVVAQYDRGREELAIEVRDTGPGMDALRRERIFTPFAQGDANVARQFGGSGLGMAISKRLIELMGGELQLETTPGVGSTFRMTLRAPTIERPPRPSGGILPHILLVDPSPSAREAWDAACIRHGALSTIVASTEEATRTLEKRHRVVVLDAKLVPSIEALRALRESWSERGDLPIVLAVRTTDLDFAKTLRDANLIAATTLKPLSYARVAAAVEQVTMAPSTRRPVAPSSNALRVLIVDDDRINRLASRLLLTRLGHTVVEADGGGAGVQAALEQRFDVVLLDLHMPDLLGTEVARQIRGTEGPSQRALLVALTAAAFAADREECERAGMDAFLTKPFAPAAMHDVLERAERERVRTERETTKG